MKERGISKRITALLLAVFMTVVTIGASQTPVSAASFTNTKLKPWVSAVAISEVRLRWNRVSGAQGYAVWKRTGSNKSWGGRIATISSGSTTTYKVGGLGAYKTYQFAVRAFKKQNGKTVWTKYTAISGSTAMYPVTAKATVYGNTQIQVTWNRVGGASYYAIWRRKKGGKWGARLTNVSSGTSSYMDSDVSPNTTYEYCVRAYATYNKKQYVTKIIASKAVTTPKSAYFTSAQKEVVKKILYAVESGGQIYGNQNYGDFAGVGQNTSNEVAITIGAGQWYGVEAKRLLQLIQSRFPAKFKQLDTAGIAEDLNNYSWSTYGVTRSSAKGQCIIKIITSAEGKACQDSLMITQITEMETVIRKNTNVSDARAVAECINMYHHGGWGSVTRVLKKTKTPYTLDHIYEALQTDTGNQVGTYTSRQKCVYTWLKQYM